MKKLLTILLLIIAVNSFGQGNWTLSGAKNRWANGMGLGSKDTASYTNGSDTNLLVLFNGSLCYRHLLTDHWLVLADAAGGTGFVLKDLSNVNTSANLSIPTGQIGTLGLNLLPASGLAAPTSGYKLFDSVGLNYMRSDGIRKRITWQGIAANIVDTITKGGTIAMLSDSAGYVSGYARKNLSNVTTNSNLLIPSGQINAGGLSVIGNTTVSTLTANAITIPLAGIGLSMSNSTTTQTLVKFINTGNTSFIGIDNSAGTGVGVSGSTAYATLVGTASNVNMHFVTGNIVNATLDPNGNLTVRNGISTGAITGTTISGTLVTAAQPNITLVGNLTGLTVTGQALAGTLSVTANIKAGTLSILGNSDWGNTGLTSFVNLAGQGSLNGGYTVISSNAGVSTNYNGLAIVTNSVKNVIPAEGNTSLPSWMIDQGGYDNITYPGSFDKFTIRRAAAGSSTYVDKFSVDASGNIAGTLSTSAQPNITSLGILTGLTINAANQGLYVSGGNSWGVEAVNNSASVATIIGNQTGGGPLETLAAASIPRWVVSNSGVLTTGSINTTGTGQFSSLTVTTLNVSAYQTNGVFTPTGNGITYTSGAYRYFVDGNKITVMGQVTFPINVDANPITVSLPFTSNPNSGYRAGGGLWSSYTTGLQYLVANGFNYFTISTVSGGGGNLPNSTLSGATIFFSFSYSL